MRKKTNGCLKSGYLMRCNSLKNNILPFINAFGAAGDTQSSDRPIDDPLLLVIFHWIPSHTHSELLGLASSTIIILIYHDIPTIKYLPILHTHYIPVRFHPPFYIPMTYPLRVNAPCPAQLAGPRRLWPGRGSMSQWYLWAMGLFSILEWGLDRV